MSDSPETTIRLSLLTLTLTAIASLALPARVHAQSSHGSIGVSAVILAAPPVATAFIRVAHDSVKTGTRTFVAQPMVRAAESLPRLTFTARDTTVRIERLILAGT